MSDHRHATDQKERTVVAGCPEGCQSFELEVSGKDQPVDQLVETVAERFGECSKCGGEMGFVSKEEPAEVFD